MAVQEAKLSPKQGYKHSKLELQLLDKLQWKFASNMPVVLYRLALRLPCFCYHQVNKEGIELTSFYLLTYTK